MKQGARVVGFAVLVSQGMGFLLVAMQMGPRVLATQSGMLEFLWFAMVLALPASLPMTLAGAAIAVRYLRRGRGRRSLLWWGMVGCAWGVVLGAFGSAAWFGAINSVQPGFLKPARFFALIGASAGGVVGGVVGVYCWRESQSATGP